MRGQKKLTQFKVNSLKAVGKYSDGLGLYLLIPRPGEKFWTFRYMRAGKARQFGLGPLHSVTLMQAREKALEARELLLDGKDPIEVKHAKVQAQRVEKLRSITFREACERFMATDAVQKLKDHKSWRRTLEEACKTIGALPLAAIDRPLVLKALQPYFDRKKDETARRTRGRIERVFSWALALGMYAGTNPAAEADLRDAMPSKPKARHHAALPYTALPSFMQQLRQRDSASAKALELVILTAARTGEAIGAQWSEFDLEQAVWVIPSQRMKAGKPHRVPLSDRAVELLRAMPRNGEHVFGNGKPLSNMALLELLKGMAPGVTTHGFRSTFMDWAHERTSYPKHVIDLALAHTIGDKVEAAYRRGDLYEKRARLMQQWCDYLEAPAGAGDNVVKLSA
jgi:integrase